MSDETDRSARAGEYVLGLLEGRDAEAAEMEMRTDGRNSVPGVLLRSGVSQPG